MLALSSFLIYLPVQVSVDVAHILLYIYRLSECSEYPYGLCPPSLSASLLWRGTDGSQFYLEEILALELQTKTIKENHHSIVKGH